VQLVEAISMSVISGDKLRLGRAQMREIAAGAEAWMHSDGATLENPMGAMYGRMGHQKECYCDGGDGSCQGRGDAGGRVAQRAGITPNLGLYPVGWVTRGNLQGPKVCQYVDGWLVDMRAEKGGWGGEQVNVWGAELDLYDSG